MRIRVRGADPGNLLVFRERDRDRETEDLQLRLSTQFRPLYDAKKPPTLGRDLIRMTDADASLCLVAIVILYMGLLGMY